MDGTDKELSDTYTYARSVSRALVHSDTQWTLKELARLQGERAGFIFRYNEILGYRAEK